jgi:predicted nucleic acid-binding protein
MILCDAGVLLCLVDRTQPQHKAYKSSVLSLAKPLVTTWSCLTEAMYLALHRGGWQMQKQLGQVYRMGIAPHEKNGATSLLGDVTGR